MLKLEYMEFKSIKKAWEEKIKEKDLTQKTLFGDGM